VEKLTKDLNTVKDILDEAGITDQLVRARIFAHHKAFLRYYAKELLKSI